MKKLSYFVTTLLLGLLAINNVFACTDFRVVAKDNTIVIARSMEFAVDMQSNLRSSPREREFNTTTPDGKPGMTWKSKYGYLYVDGMSHDFAIDGMNEAGLSFEYLYLPGETQYQTVPEGQEANALPYYNLGHWILGNFQTVDEARQALANIYVFQQMIPGLGDTVFPVHAAIFDKSGKGIVVEFIAGKMYVYDHVGVMTNSPIYAWQVTNLRNYINLTPYAPDPVEFGGQTFTTTGQGSGMQGLPGDFSPPSRFVKTSALLKSAYTANNAGDAVNLALHIINNVDIPMGTVRAKQGSGVSNDYTQWVVVKDLVNKVFYYRTYDDLMLHFVPLDKVDFSPKAPLLKMPLADRALYLDVTDRFVNQKPAG